MAKKTRAVRKATTSGRPKVRIGTKEATDAINDLIKRIRRVKAGDTGWNVLERAQIELADHVLNGALEVMGCPPTESIPRPKKRFRREE